MTKNAKSRAVRWLDAASAANDALEELVDIQAEFQEWRDNLPENLASSATAELLDAIVDLDIESAQATIQDAVEIDLPSGFGRD